MQNFLPKDYADNSPETKTVFQLDEISCGCIHVGVELVCKISGATCLDHKLKECHTELHP